MILVPGNALQEYVIRLSADLDNSGVQQLLSYMDSTRLKALGLTAAITGITTAIYKFASATVEKEFELQKLAKTQHKTTMAINASNTALKAMGMTLQEVNKDKYLKGVYENLKKINEEMELPNADRALEKVKKLRSAFWQLKDVLNYAIQHIGRQFLINMERPIERITGGLDDISSWVRNNLNSISAKVSSVLTAFSKGVFGIGETIGFIFQKVAELPDNIKLIGVALAGVFAFTNMGPLGRILTLIGLIGDVIHDKDVWDFNKENGTDIETAYGDIWEIAAGEGSTREKASKIATRVFEGIEDGLKDAINKFNEPGGSGLREWMSGLTGPFGEFLGGLVDWAESDEGRTQIVKAGGELLTAAATALETAGKLSNELIGGASQLLFQIFAGPDWEKAWEGSGLDDFFNSGENSIATGIGTSLVTALLGGDFKTSLATGIVSGYKNLRGEALRKLYEAEKNNPEWKPHSAIEYDEEGNPLYTWLENEFGFDPRLPALMTIDFQQDFNETFAIIMKGLVSGLEIADDTAGWMLKAIIQAFSTTLGTDAGTFGNTVTEALNEIGENNGLWDALSLGLSAWIGTGDFVLGLATAIGDAMKTYASDPNGLEKLKQDAEALKEAILTLWYGAWTDETHTERNGIGLKTVFDALFGENGSLKEIFDELGKNIVVWLEPVKTALLEFFSGLWIELYNASPQWVKDMLTIMGAENPNSSKIVQNEDGTYKLVSTNKQERELTAVEVAALSGYDLEHMALKDDGTLTHTRGREATPDITIEEIVNAFKEHVIESFVSATGVPGGSGQGWQYLPSFINGVMKWGSSWEDHVNDVFGGDEEAALLYWANGFNIQMQKRRSDQERQRKENAVSGSPSGRTLVRDGAGKYYSVEYGENGEIDFSKGVLGVDENGWYNIEDTAPMQAAINNSYYMESMGYGAISPYTKMPGVSADQFGNLNEILSYFNDNPIDLQTNLEEPGNASGFAENTSNIVGTVRIKTVLDGPAGALSGFFGKFGAQGGRFDTATPNMTIGEDGTEYLIPITKPERAASLIQQMFSEMGSSAVSNIMNRLGLGQSGTNGASLASLETAMSGMAMNNSYNINAPVNINVNSTGADAKEIGSSIYDMAERHLIKNVMGVYA